ncbi:MAG: acetylornithine transaminase [Candidatus Ancillula sp.]|nr:acetylornithine transaminase [Candidatus Ancillula sp.]
MENKVLEVYEKNYMKNFGMPKMVISRARGSYVFDHSGRAFTDLIQGIAVNCLGHSHPRLSRTIAAQASSLMHVSNFFTTKQQTDLAEKLCELVNVDGEKRVLLTSSGTESVESALKIAKKRRPDGKIIALNNSFHGRTIGSLSVTSNEKYRAPFSPLMPNVKFISANVKSLEKAVKSSEVAAIILECVQGEAGVLPLDAEFIKRAREVSSEVGALLIVDEVQTGMGRTGTWFSFQQFGIVPDVVTLAKSLGGGFPIGAVIAIGEAAETLAPGDHGTTFGGNPLACAAALEVIKTIEDDRLLVQSGMMKGFVEEIVKNSQSPFVKQVRGLGSLIGIELTANRSAEVAAKCLEDGVIVNSVNPNTLRIAPAYNIDLSVLMQALKVIVHAVTTVFTEQSGAVSSTKTAAKSATNAKSNTSEGGSGA